jgi:iron complex outermembrane receptor protein
MIKAALQPKKLSIAVIMANSLLFVGSEINAEQLVLEEVVVTAQKRAESLQDVPMSISAFGEKAIERKGLANAADLINNVPNLNGYEAPGGRGSLSIAIRGVNPGSPSNLSIDPANAMYLDGVYVGKSTGLALDVSELERIEVLRGPQGTLYGRNATGGAISFITKKPTGELGGKVSATVGSDSLWGIKGMLNLPAIGKTGEGMGSLSTSLAYQTRQRDPLYDSRNDIQDGFDDMDREAMRLALRWEPTEVITVDYNYDQSELDELSALQKLIGLTATDANSGPGFTPVSRLDGVKGQLAFAQSLASQPGADPRIADRLIPSYQALIGAYSGKSGAGESWPGKGESDLVSGTYSETKGHGLTLSWGLENLEIKSITGYREMENRNYGDLDGIDSSLNANGVGAINDGTLQTLLYGHAGYIPGIPQGPLLNQLYDDIDALGGGHSNQDARADYNQFSQEIQFIGQTDNLQYVVGLYWFEDDSEYSNKKVFVAPVGPLQSTDYDSETEAWAIFSQATYTPEILDQRLSLTAGLRYTEEEKKITYNYLTAGSSIDRTLWGLGYPSGSGPAPDGYDPANPYALLPTSNYGYKDDASFDNVSGSLTVAYQLSDYSNTFLRYATGYRSGGFNGESLDTDINGNPVANAYDEETIEQWELGVKSQLFDQRMQLNAALFWYEIDDAQTSSIGLGASGAVTSAVGNAGQAERYGAELEVMMLASEDLLIRFSAAWMDGAFEEFGFCGNNTNCYYQDGTPINDDFVADHAKRANSPDLQFNLGFDYTVARLNFGTVNFYLDAAWKDVSYPAAIWTSAQSDGDQIVYDPIETDQSTLVNARLSLDEVSVGDGQFSTALWVKNLTDDDYSTFGINYGPLGIITDQIGQPRTYGLDLNYAF